MADFRFNFTASDDEESPTNDQTDGGDAESQNHCGPAACEIQWIPLEMRPDLQNLTTVQHSFGSYTLLTVATAAVEDYLLLKKEGETACGVVKAISGHSDLVAGQYEGGLKVWECSVDLCDYLSDCGRTMVGSRVLELGCGGGLPGMLAAKMGAACVHFQDFNHEVLEMYTMVNIGLNNIQPSSCAFFAGDWADFASLAESRSNTYDVILTAETIYNVSSYSKLLKVFSLLLTNSGVVLVAAKSEYFGVGGSVSSFMQCVRDSQQFVVEVVKHIHTGVPRMILKLTRV